MASGFKSELTDSFSIPCDDNPTVAMVEAAYRHFGLNWRYVNADVPPAGLGGAVELVLAGVRRLTIVNRSAARAEELAAVGRAAKPIDIATQPWTGMAGAMRKCLEEVFA